jgi:hypothetical protein
MKMRQVIEKLCQTCDIQSFVALHKLGRLRIVNVTNKSSSYAPRK